MLKLEKYAKKSIIDYFYTQKELVLTNKMKYQPEENRCYSKQTNTFNLTVKLTSISLTLTLQDRTAWLIFERTYTESDIGKTFHRKVELSDLYFSLMQTSRDENEKEKDKKEEEEWENQYTFGEVVKVKDLPCYKIEEKGVVTVYVVLYDRNQRQAIYESKLELKKVRPMNNVEILLAKFKEERITGVTKQKLLQLFNTFQQPLNQPGQLKNLKISRRDKNSEPKVQYERFPEEEYLLCRHEEFATLAIHQGCKPEPIHGSINVPIHMSSTFAQRDIAQPYSKYDYTRSGNPTRGCLQQCIAAIEYGKYCITYSSGCGATATILHTLKSGDHIIVCDEGTQGYMREYAQEKFGIETDFIDMTNLENAEKLIKRHTKLMWIETPTNPTLKIVDIKAVCQLAKKHNLIIVCDNTFATPYLQSPLHLGVDISYNSCTKYLGGHSDLVMGAIVLNNEELYKKLLHASTSLGVNPSPFDCFLLHRGIKTLELRVIKSTENAYHLAHWMEKNKFIVNVIYPGLKSHPQHELAKKQMRGYGGMISFRLKGGREQVSKFLKSLKLFTLASSLGGVESLAQFPAQMTIDSSMPVEERIQLGITDNLIRLSVGIQWIEDIIADISQALDASQR